MTECDVMCSVLQPHPANANDYIPIFDYVFIPSNIMVHFYNPVYIVEYSIFGQKLVGMIIEICKLNRASLCIYNRLDAVIDL